MNKGGVIKYDVVVIGGGPAGGQCARKLAMSGVNVLLVERYKSFEDNNFSSAGMLYETVKDFGIPKHVVGAYWNRIIIESSTKTYEWKGDEDKGAVLDFARLRTFLADECKKHGGEVWMGHRYLKKEKTENGLLLSFKNGQTNELVYVETKLAIDATGPSRKVMFDEKEEQGEMLLASAVEYLIEVPQEVYDKYDKALVFFLGKKWADEAYSWIFPMENRLLKVGSGKYFYEIKKSRSSKELTEVVIKDYLGLASYKLINSHGGVYRYSSGLKDVFYKNKVVGVGDVVSSVNPLGGEGIRYAMLSADMLIPYVLSYLKTGKNNFEAYRKEWRRKHYFKWWLCELVSKRVYKTYSDEKMDLRLAQYAKRFTTIDELNEILFKFNFKKVAVRIMFTLSKKLIPFKKKLSA